MHKEDKLIINTIEVGDLLLKNQVTHESSGIISNSCQEKFLNNIITFTIISIFYIYTRNNYKCAIKL